MRESDMDELLSGGKLEAQAETLAALSTRMERVLAISDLYERKPQGWSWIHGRAKTIWAREIAALPERDARRQALQEIPPGDLSWVEAEVRRLWTLRREAGGA